MRTAFLALAILLGSAAARSRDEKAEAERRAYILANYTKYEHRIPMRDGVRLFTSVYVPKDDSQKYPILMMRTPYSVAPYGSDNYSMFRRNFEKFLREKFIFVYQDVRGKTKSEGEFVDVRPQIVKRGPKDIDESTDSYDTIDWLVKNVPQNNGNVGIWGVSYPGFYAAMATIDAHPALKAASPQAPVADWFVGDDWRHNGALFLAHTFHFMTRFGRPFREPGEMPAPGPFDLGTPDGYDFFLRLGPLSEYRTALFGTQARFWNELMEHDRMDEFWKARNYRPYLKNVRPAVMTVGGWFDAEDLLGPLTVYESIERQSPETKNTLVMGPWSHGQWMSGDGERVGNARFAAKTGEFFRDSIMLPFFTHRLKDQKDPGLPEAYVFETGRNQWRKHAKWPPAEAAPRTLYLAASGRLRFDAAGGSGYDEYVSDPNKPVPFTDEVAAGMTYNYMTSDQRFAARRTDVLVYETEPLETDMTLAGPVECNLQVSTSGTDADWIVKLVDGYPGNYPNPDPNPAELRMGGYQQLVRGEPFRGRFRNGFEKPEPFVPGRSTAVRFSMPDVYHTFRRGHRLIVHVQSSWFPLVDRNPQKFMPVHKAARADFEIATQRVYRGGENGSRLTVRVLP
jgi:putative CocE/NonD family hydrolase